MPPVMLKRVDGGLVDPVQDNASQRAQREHDRAAQGFAMTRTAVDDYYSHARKKGKLGFFQRTHPYTQMQRLAESVQLDPQRGHFKTPGIDSELQDFLQADFNEFATFADYFAALHSQLGFQSDYELAQTLVHSVALQLAPNLADHAKGLILARSLENFTKGLLQPDGQPLTVDALAGKVALRLVHAKVRAIVAGKQRGSAFERAGLLDFFLRDSYVPRPSAEIVQWLREQVYPDSLGGQLDSLRHGGFSEDFEERLQRNYFEAKAAAICRFLGLNEKTVLRVDGDSAHFELGELFTQAQNGDEHSGSEDRDLNEKKLMAIELKALLAHKDVVRTLDAKITKLEQALRLYDTRPPVAEKVAQQLELLLHSLPSRLKARFLADGPQTATKFDPRYVNRSFNNLQLQWHALDLDFPAEIMPVQDYLEHQRTMQNLPLLVPKGSYFNERLTEMQSRLEVERETDSGDEGEIERQRESHAALSHGSETIELTIDEFGDNEERTISRTIDSVSVSHDGKTPIGEQPQRNEKKAEPERTEKEFVPGVMPLHEVARRMHLSLAERKELFPLGEQALEQIAEEEREEKRQANSLADEAMEEDSEVSDADRRKQQRLEKISQMDAEQDKVAFLALHRRDRVDVFDERHAARADKLLDPTGRPYYWDNLDKQRPHSLESERLLSTLMASASEQQERFSVIAQLENAREDDLETQFDRLPTGEKKSVTLFRELRRPVYFKHYVAQAFREFYAHNPYDNAHFVDDALNPNLGFYMGSPIDPTALASTDAGRGDLYGLRSFRSRLSAVSPLSPEAVARSKPRMHAFGRGKRKTSEAFAVVTSPGTGRVTVNNREFIEYFGLESSRFEVLTPLIMSDRTCRVDLKLFVSGGGVAGQATACTVAVAKALVKAFPELQKPFYDNYMFWTDARQVERKKTGKYKARKSYTYVRR